MLAKQMNMDDLYINISKFRYSRWLEIIFNHHPQHAEQADSSKVPDLIMTNPRRVVKHFTRFCRDFKTTAEQSTPSQLNLALWCLLGASGIRPTLPECLFTRKANAAQCCTFKLRQPIPQNEILECIRSMYFVFSDYVAVKDETMENCFYMWWDLICEEFWFCIRCNKIYDGKDKLQYSDLAQEDREIIDCIFETLCSILLLDDEKAQYFALHGLGHSKHPGARLIVQDYINNSAGDWEPDGVRWLESCRDGTVM